MNIVELAASTGIAILHLFLMAWVHAGFAVYYEAKSKGEKFHSVSLLATSTAVLIGFTFWLAFRAGAGPA